MIGFIISLRDWEPGLSLCADGTNESPVADDWAERERIKRTHSHLEECETASAYRAMFERR
jgi:hypothetical protein